MSTANGLLDGLSESTRERLRPHLQLVHLTHGRLLADVGDPLRHAYFPTAGMISVLGLTQQGDALEVATVGATGCCGVLLALQATSSPYRVVVQLPGGAYRVSADVVRRELARSNDLHRAFLRGANELLQQATQSAICATFHQVLPRLCRWLLVSRGHARSGTIDLTQEFIAQMLGVSRPRVSQSLMVLETRHMIHQGLGRIHMVDRDGLENLSCECYRVGKERSERALATAGAI
jgi:CRP-like cAMP-binding protein